MIGGGGDSDEGGFPFSYLSSPGLSFVSPVGCDASFVKVRWPVSISELESTFP